jgi:chorismate synthase
MSIPGTRGVEIGAGFESARMKGSESNDVFFMDKGAVRTKTNNAGGIIGGISDGMPIILRIALKPTASIGIPQKTVDYKKKKETEIEITGRHDPCIVPRAVPVVESMLGLVFADHSIMAGYIPRRLQ